MDVELFISQLMNGLANGAVYASVALALVLIFRTTGILNFAQGEMALFSTYVTWQFTDWGLAVWLSIVLSVALSFIGGALIERVVIRPVEKSSPLVIVIVTIGLFLSLNSLAQVIFGTDVKRVPRAYPNETWSVGDVVIRADTLVLIGVLIVEGFLLWLLLQKTKIGLALRAVAANSESSSLVGVQVGTMLMFGWALAAAIGALAGALVIPTTAGLSAASMQSVLVFAFAAAALGGFDSPLGAVVGGITIGVVDALTRTYFDGRWILPDLQGIELVMPFTLILLVLLFKPAGLFGKVKVERVQMTTIDRRARTSRRPRTPWMGLTAGRLIGTVVGAFVVGFLLYVPQYYKASTVDLYTTSLYVGIAAMGLNILTGYNGQVSIGHGAFFGLGAYTSALLIQHEYHPNVFGLEVTIGHWPFLPTLLVSAGLCFVVGALIGFPALRVHGLYLALVTLGLAVIFPDLTKRFVKGTGGTNLLSLKQSELAPPNWYDWFADPIADPLTDRIGARDQWAFYVTFVVGALLLLVVLLIARSRFGRSLIAVRDHEAAAATVGVNLARTKVTAFAISALYAGLAGSLSLLVTGTANAGKVETFQLSIQFLVALVIGGTATVVGPMVGAFIIVFAQDWIEKQQTVEDLLDPERAKLLSPAVFGIALIIMMYVMPDGLVGGGRRLIRRALHSRPPPKPALT